jgi:transcriptional antiterminator NusG
MSQKAETNEAKWYVVHTYSGYENKVKVNLEKTVENRGLQEQILEINVPTEEVIEVKNGKRKLKQEKVFHGYVMVKMIMNDETWYVVRNTRGVTGFVGPGSKPIPLSDKEVVSMGMERIPLKIDIAVGDNVRIVKTGRWELHGYGGGSSSRTPEGAGLGVRCSAAIRRWSWISYR